MNVRSFPAFFSFSSLSLSPLLSSLPTSHPSLNTPKKVEYSLCVKEDTGSEHLSNKERGERERV